MSLKSHLKAAKEAIGQEDSESILEHVAAALKLDKNNYFAYLFQGKAYQIDKIPQKAVLSFERATQIDPKQTLGWKAYHQASKTTQDDQLVFDTLFGLLQALTNANEPIADTCKDFHNWLDQRKYKSDEALYELFLSQFIPGGRLTELVGNLLGVPLENLRTLLDIKVKKMEHSIKTKLMKERMKYGKVISNEGQIQIDKFTWNIYQEFEIVDNLYENYLTVCNDTKLRQTYQDKHLKYKYELLKCCPPTLKSKYYEEINSLVELMVLIESPTSFCWNIYFDWLDVKLLTDLNFKQISFYLKTFPLEGLANVFYAFLLSELSPFDRKLVIESLEGVTKVPKKRSQRKRKPKKVVKEEEQDEEQAAAAALQEISIEPTKDESIYNLPPAEILSMMVQGGDKTSSVLASRIICEYCIHLREYTTGSSKCRESIKLLADLLRTFKIELANTKESFLCSLAMVYTYFEAPKNFTLAMQLYERILKTNPLNLRAQVGKALILMEKEEYEQARDILELIVGENVVIEADKIDTETINATENVKIEKTETDETDIGESAEAVVDDTTTNATIEYGWCLIKLNNHTLGRQILISSLKNLPGSDLYSSEIRAKVNYRIARSYYLEDAINNSYKHLVKSLEESETYAESYSLLGVLLNDHYNDPVKAQKCFYKAFELDSLQVLSAKYLVADLTSKNEWEISDILCTRIISTDSSRRILQSKSYTDEDNSWPYRALGSSALNRQDDAKAIEWFQTALRMTPVDVNCWLGLGEAYMNCGRLDASIKVFKHLLTLVEETNWIVRYQLGLAICQTTEFEEGFVYLHEAHELKPKEQCVLSALFETHIEYSYKLISGGFFGRAIAYSLKAIQFIKESKAINRVLPNLWKSLGESLRVFLIVQEHIELFPIELVLDILHDIDFTLSNDLFNNTLKEWKEGNSYEGISSAIILANIAGFKHLPNRANKYLQSISYYNIGLAYLQSYNLLLIISDREIAIKFLKKAIQLEDNNASFWVSLGNAYISHNPQISQHCFIKATTLDTRDATIWTNLAVLYLRYGDAELAQQAFLRSQSVAPQDSQSWLGHALAAEAIGDDEAAARLFTHAFVLSNGRSPLAQLLYGLSIVDKRIGDSSLDPRNVDSAQEFSVANFAMAQYLKFAPKDIAGLQIALTISERCKDWDRALEIAESLCGVLEEQYEKDESQVTLKQYALAKTQLSRVYLGLANYSSAIENAEFVLNLSEEESKITLSLRVVVGLGLFFNNQFDEALEQFKLILAEHNDSPRLVTLVAQILNGHDSEESKTAALDQLFGFIEEFGLSLIVVLTLGAISIVDNLDDYMGAIKEELEGLSLNELIGDSFRTVPKLLSEINKKLESKQIGLWQRNALMFPSDFNVWKQLNQEMALTVATLRDNKVTAELLSEVYLSGGRLREIQRSILVFPGLENVNVLKGCLSS